MTVLQAEPPARQKPIQAKVVALVPARNEEASIGDTITSLMQQTLPFDHVLVIANNCTDQTVPIVQQLQAQYGADRLRLLVMAHNRHKKAGALNAGFATIKDSDAEFVFSMDADTILRADVVETAVRQFRHEPRTGGICSGYRALPLQPTATHWQRFVWRMQNIEFGLANAWRLEHYDSARVLPGVAVMFRMTALRHVYQKHGDGTVWAIDSLVEDYRLTLELKDFGWRAKSSLDMVSWSDVPLKLRGKGGLWDQRQRWYSGTVDEIRRRGFSKKHSHYEVFTICLLMLDLIMRTLLVSAYVVLVVRDVPVHWWWPFLALPIAAAAAQLYRLRYTDQLDKWQVAFTGTLLLNELYATYRECIYAYGIWLSYRRPNRVW